MRTIYILYACLTICSVGKFWTPSYEWESKPDILFFWCDRIYGWWAASTFLAGTVGIGYRICQSFSCLQMYTKKLSFFAFLVLGSFCLYTLLFMASLLAVLSHSMVVLFFVFLVVAGLRETWILLKKIPSVSLSFPGCRKFFIYTGGLCILGWIFPYFIQTLLPTNEWDSAVYHIPMAKRLLYQGFWHVDQIASHYNFCGAMNLFYALFLAIDAESAILPFQFCMLFFCFLSVYEISESIWNRRVALWAVCLLAANNILWEVSITYRIDSLHAFYATIAILGLSQWIKESFIPGHLIVSGMALGIASGIKYTSVFLFFPMLMPISWVLWKKCTEWKRTCFYLSFAISFVLFPSSLWYVRNAIELGNPFYDYVTGPVYRNSQGKIKRFYPALQRFIEEHIPYEKLEDLKKQKLLGLQMDTPSIFPERSLLTFWNIFLCPKLHTRQPYHWVNPILIFFLALPLFHRKAFVLWSYFIAISAFIMPACMTYLVRYIVFLLPVFSIGASLVIERINHIHFQRVMIFLCFLVFIFNIGAEWKKLEGKFCKEIFLEQKNKLEWLCKVGFDNSNNMPMTIGFMNDMIRKNPEYRSRAILMLMEAKGDGLLCPYIPDTGFIGLPWLYQLVETNGNFPKILDNFQKANIHWIYTDISFARWVLRESQVNRDFLACSLYFLEKFTEKYTEKIPLNGDKYLFKISHSLKY